MLSQRRGSASGRQGSTASLALLRGHRRASNHRPRPGHTSPCDRDRSWQSSSTALETAVRVQS